ncbi:P-loop containing nucleoside triphosphate hydrolase protein [Infundibulicybe gibba]|nr:P-loop containing nucleoside triphosphate hydrolase protein [Infundibulicybe gibba]
MEHFQITPDVYKSACSPIQVTKYHESSLHINHLNSFITTVTDGIIGVAPAYGTKCTLEAIAFASLTHVIYLQLAKAGKSRSKQIPTPRLLLQNTILCHPYMSKYAFKMDRVVAAVHLDLGLGMTDGVDLCSRASLSSRDSLESIMVAMGGEVNLQKEQTIKLFKDEERITGGIRNTALQAWVACRAANQTREAVAKIGRINTATMGVQQLALLAKTIRDADRLMSLKPHRVKNDIETDFTMKQGKLQMKSSRFRTRIMPNRGHQKIEIQSMAGGKVQTVTGTTSTVNGRAVEITLRGQFSGSKITSVNTVGREAKTAAESQRAGIMLRALECKNTILQHPFVQKIWLPQEQISWATTPSFSIPIPVHFLPPDRQPNLSQINAIKLILSNKDADRVVLIHGPPGTGKTTVIAGTVTSIMASADKTRTLWLVGQSNVAVKNIAEKLASIGFVEFRLLVSKDFHYDWHEHLYEKIIPNIVRSDTFQHDIVAVERQLQGCRVILCTLSMLSHDKLAPFARVVPVQTVIFDEASQIEIGDFFPMLARFRPTLRKLVFVGDDKQYRMPIPLGNFISKNIYKNKLKSVHAVISPRSCQFVDVSNGKEEHRGQSWANTREINVVLAVARRLHNADKSYRIITPYDAQRSAIETALKSAAPPIPWEDKCFNVDSFQGRTSGNEADYIILSLVRSEKLGFMKEPRRVNVMLSRCKKGMIICTNRAWVESKAAKSLIGKLAEMLGQADSPWMDGRSVQYGNPRFFFP